MGQSLLMVDYRGKASFSVKTFIKKDIAFFGMANLRKIIAVSLLSFLPYSSIPAGAMYIEKPALSQVVATTVQEEDSFFKKFGHEKLEYTVDHRYFEGRMEMEFKKAKDPRFDYDLLTSLYIDNYKFLYSLLVPFLVLSGTPTNIDTLRTTSHVIVKDGKLVVLERAQQYVKKGEIKKETWRRYDYKKRMIIRKEFKDKEERQYAMEEGVKHYEELFSFIYNLRAGAYGKLAEGASFSAHMHSKGKNLKLNFRVKEMGKDILKIESDLNQKKQDFVLEECILENNEALQYPIKTLEVDYHGRLTLERYD